MFLVFTYELVEQVLMNPDVFSSRNKEAMLGRSIIAEQMGVPLEEVPQVKKWADAFHRGR